MKGMKCVIGAMHDNICFTMPRKQNIMISRIITAKQSRAANIALMSRPFLNPGEDRRDLTAVQALASLSRAEPADGEGVRRAGWGRCGAAISSLAAAGAESLAAHCFFPFTETRLRTAPVFLSGLGRC